jgi:hypothetical protein
MKGVTQRWHRLAILAEDVKSLAEDEEIPIIAIHQANRLGEKTFGNTTADMADSDVIAREADLIARIIKRPGEELYEEDYEVEIERAKVEAAARKTERPRKGRPRIKVKREKLADVVEFEDLDEPRMGAKLAIVLPGNREGVLDAFTINAVPGYNFEFISSDYSVGDIEEWVKADESGNKGAGGSGPKKEKTNQPVSQQAFKKWKTNRAKEAHDKGET